MRMDLGDVSSYMGSNGEPYTLKGVRAVRRGVLRNLLARQASKALGSYPTILKCVNEPQERVEIHKLESRSILRQVEFHLLRLESN